MKKYLSIILAGLLVAGTVSAISIRIGRDTFWNTNLIPEVANLQIGSESTSTGYIWTNNLRVGNASSTGNLNVAGFGMFNNVTTSDSFYVGGLLHVSGIGTSTVAGNLNVAGDLAVINTYLTNQFVTGFSSSTSGLYTQGNLHVGGIASFDGTMSGAGLTAAQQSFWNATTTWSAYDTNWNRKYNATTTLNGFTPANYLLTSAFATNFNTNYNATTTLNGFTNNQANWNTAFGWGNHASGGYASSTGLYTKLANSEFASYFATNYNATTTLNGFTPGNYLLSSAFATNFNTNYNATTTLNGFTPGNYLLTSAFGTNWNSSFNGTSTWAYYDTNWNRNYNATTTLNGFTPGNYLLSSAFATNFATQYNATTTLNGFTPGNYLLTSNFATNFNTNYNATTTLNGFTPGNYIDFTTWYASTTREAMRLNGQLPTYYATSSGLYTKLANSEFASYFATNYNATTTLNGFTPGNYFLTANFNTNWATQYNATTTLNGFTPGNYLLSSAFATNFNTNYNATTTLNGFTPGNYLLTSNFATNFNTNYNATTTLNGFTPGNYLTLSTYYSTTTWAGGGNLSVTGNATTTGRTVFGSTNPTNNYGKLWIGGDSYISGNSTTTGNVYLGTDQTNFVMLDDGQTDTAGVAASSTELIFDAQTILPSDNKYSLQAKTAGLFSYFSISKKGSVPVPDAFSVLSSGGIGIGLENGADNDYIYFDGWTTQGLSGSQYLRWTNATDQFDLSNDLSISGNATTSGHLVIGTVNPTINMGAGALLVGGAATTTHTLYVGGYASSTGGLFTQGNGHVGGTFSVDGNATSSGRLVLGSTNPTNNFGKIWVGGDAWINGSATTTHSLQVQGPLMVNTATYQTGYGLYVANSGANESLTVDTTGRTFMEYTAYNETTTNPPNFYIDSSSGRLFRSTYSDYLTLTTYYATTTWAGGGNLSIKGNSTSTGHLALTGLSTNATTGLTGSMCLNAANEVVKMTGAGTCVTSSLEGKENVEPLKYGLELVNQLKPVTFDFKFDKSHSLGLIAEDVIKVDTRLVAVDEKGKPFTVRYELLPAVLTKATQELWGNFQMLFSWNESQDKQIKELTERLNKLEASCK